MRCREVEGVVGRAGHAVDLLGVVVILALQPEVEEKLFCGAALKAAGLSRLTTPELRMATPTPPIERIGRVPGVFCSPMPYIV